MTGTDQFLQAARLISQADGLIIAAGAGMGVDSGLPDFRGDSGFWRHYPALQKANISFYEMASPSHFRHSPQLAWGFYGHRLALYRKTKPHAGFRILKDIANRLEHNAFVFTSNVDGQFQQAGFAEEQVHECHGSIHYLQCLDPCHEQIWPASGFSPEVNEDCCQLVSAPPVCPVCGLLARPNILMFNDMSWLPGRSDGQYEKLQAWRQKTANPVVIELGAGTAIATVRYFAERQRCPLIRINPREAHLHRTSQNVSLPYGALEALEGIHDALVGLSFMA